MGDAEAAHTLFAFELAIEFLYFRAEPVFATRCLLPAILEICFKEQLVVMKDK